MKIQTTNCLAVFAHPGHELKIYSYLKILKPIVVILSDGSGHSDQSRVYQSLEIIQDIDCTPSALFGNFSDKYFYDKILNQDFKFFRGLMLTIYNLILENNITTIIGDNLEGYNPLHDLCRYLINGAILKCIKQNYHNCENYYFNLTTPSLQNAFSHQAFPLRLSHQLWLNKMVAGHNYTELSNDLNFQINSFGEHDFTNECLFSLANDNLEISENWLPSEALYECFGKQRLRQNHYSQTILYAKHLQPIATDLFCFAKI